MVDDRPSCGRAADTDADTRKVLAAYVRDDGLDAVVPARAALFPNAHGSRRDVHVIVNDGQIVRRHLIVGKHGADRLATVVHVG